MNRLATTVASLTVVTTAWVGLTPHRTRAESPAMDAHGHPRLFFTSEEVGRLRHQRDIGARPLIWRNMIESAEWCLQRPLRRQWIAPVSPDPVYENLYDRFYAMMHDMAMMEHLAFAHAYSQDDRFGDAAVAWSLACCRVWRREAEGDPDGAKAYAVTRLLKGLAVSFDLLHGRFSDAEREEVRSAIETIGQSYHDDYFTTPAILGPEFCTHHAIVEWASFGVAALAVMDDYPPARQWLEAAVRKFRDHLLPKGLAPDGAQVEGATFWASTMQYRLMFMDALQRVTGEDLFTPFAEMMNGRMAVAAIVGPKHGGYDQDDETVLGQPSYGQINYYSPVLLALARHYRQPLHQHLALWDETAGGVQQTRYVTDAGEWMLFAWGGYAYAWYDPSVRAAVPADTPLSFAFPSVNEVYVRDSYEVGGIVACIQHRRLRVHAGGRPVFVDHQEDGRDPPDVTDIVLRDDGHVAETTCTGADDSGYAHQVLRLDRPGVLTVTRKTDRPHAWWCHGDPRVEGQRLAWGDGTTLEVTCGRIISVDPEGYRDTKVVGMGRLILKDPQPTAHPLITAQPSDGRLEIVVRQGPAGDLR